MKKSGDGFISERRVYAGYANNANIRGIGRHKHLQAAALEGLVVTDIGIYPELEPALTERVYDEIAVGLLDFICSRPDARTVLTGRTFVRHLH